MSILSDFMRSGFTEASKIIGKKLFSINGGDTVDAVISEREAQRDYQNQGFDTEVSLTIVIDTTLFLASYPLTLTSYFGKACLLDDEQWIVGSIKHGDTFTTIDLASRNETK